MKRLLLIVVWTVWVAAVHGAEGQPIPNYPRATSISTNTFMVLSDQNRTRNTSMAGENRTISYLATNFIQFSQINSLEEFESLLFDLPSGGAGTNSTIFVNGSSVDGANLTNSSTAIWEKTSTNVTVYPTNLSNAQISASAAIAASKLDSALATEAEVAAGYQPLDADLTDLADGSLTGSKVGTGISGDNISSGTVASARIDSAQATDAEVAAGYQPLDADLTSISALSTTAHGRGLLDDADASASRTSIGVVIGTDVQGFDADLSDLADGSLTGTKVGFSDPDNLFTATDVNAALAEFNDSINAGVPNGTGAKVHWSELLGVPAGFADGTDDGSGGATTFDAIGDSAANGSVSVGHTNIWTFSLDGSRFLQFLASDADNASDTTLLTLAFNAANDANSIFLDMISDADGTPTSIYKFGATAFVSTVPATFGTGNGQIDVGAAGVRITSDGDGAMTWLGLGDGSDEDFTINIDDTANTATVTSSTGLNLFNFSSIDVQVPTEAYDATGWNGDNTVPTKDAVRDKIEALTGVSTAWNDIGDATAGGVIASAGFTNQLTSTLDSANAIVFGIYNTDADRANDTILFELADNDGADANAIYLRMRGDVDGTPTTDYVFSQTGATFALPLSIGTGNALTAGTIELGAASDTTISRTGAGDIAVEGNRIFRVGGADVPVADGGTGASSLNDLITLGTHTTGSYAAGDAEAGGATKLRTAAGASTLSASGDIAMNSSDKQIGVHNGTKEVAIPLTRRFPFTFDPKALCDGTFDGLFLFTVTEPFGITITSWRLSFEADPTTEVDLDLKRADAFIGRANSAVMDVVDTTAGASSETTAANINSGAVVANGKVVYLEFGTAYTEANHQMIFEITYEIEED